MQKKMKKIKKFLCLTVAGMAVGVAGCLMPDWMPLFSGSLLMGSISGFGGYALANAILSD